MELQRTFFSKNYLSARTVLIKPVIVSPQAAQLGIHTKGKSVMLLILKGTV